MQNTNQFDLTEISSNLYGPTATGMLGGNITNNLFGGYITNALKKTKHKGGAPSYEIVAYPEYIKNESFYKFMTSFYLIRKISHTPASGVYIIPPPKELDALISDFHKRLNKEGIDIDSEAAFKYAATNNLPYKRYIFTVFGGDTAHYKLDKEAPYKNFDTVTRVNLASEVMYFKYLNDEEIKICNTLECNKGTTAKLIAKCNNGIYVFQGSIPTAVETKSKNTAKFIGAKRKKSKKINKFNDDVMEGGAIDDKFNTLKQELLFNNVTDEESATTFVANMALADYEQNGESAITKYAKLMSGDIIHTAFRIAFNDKCNVIPDELYEQEDVDIMTNKLIEKYKPVNKGYDRAKYSNMFKTGYKNIAKRNLSPRQSTEAYKQFIKSKFSKLGIDMLKADIATSLFRSNQDIATSYKYANEIDKDNSSENDNDVDISHFEYSGTDGSVYQTSKFNRIINQALLSAPLIGLNAMTYVPILRSSRRYKSVFNKTTMRGGLDDDVEEDEIEKNEDEFDEIEYNHKTTEDDNNINIDISNEYNEWL
jgi:hypothetical protein